jgi:hypothetical protein
MTVEYEVLMDEELFRKYSSWKDQQDYLASRKGDYWISVEGRTEICSKYFANDGHPPKPLLDALTKAEVRRDYLEVVVINLQAYIKKLELGRENG